MINKRIRHRHSDVERARKRNICIAYAYEWENRGTPTLLKSFGFTREDPFAVILERWAVVKVCHPKSEETWTNFQEQWDLEKAC